MMRTWIILCKCEVIGEPGGGAGRTSKTTYEDCLGRASVAVDDARLPDSVVSGAGHLSVSSVGRGSDSSYISSSICLVNLEPFASSFKKKKNLLLQANAIQILPSIYFIILILFD